MPLWSMKQLGKKSKLSFSFLLIFVYLVSYRQARWQ